MTIVFLCGSAHPGHDGVGDYTRRLAAELNAQGHTASILSSHDRGVTSITAQQQPEAGGLVQVTRIPFTMDAERRMEAIASGLEQRGAEWVSLQFVPFSFHPKGLPVTFLHHLSATVAPYRLQIMFHELWQGMDAEASFKSKLAGRLQRGMIRVALRSLQPALVATQATPYRALLGRMVPGVIQLPLVSNIPPIAEVERFNGSSDPIRMVFFAAIYPQHCILRFVAQLSDWIDETGKRVEFHFVGRNGDAKAAIVEIIKGARRAGAMKVVAHGEGDPAFISRILNDCHLGLTTFPYALTEKSGSVAAYRAHGLPTLCLSANWTLRYAVPGPQAEDIRQLNGRPLARQLERLQRAEVPRYSVADLGKQFISTLNSSARG